MKILQVIPKLAKGGAEKVVVDLLNSQEQLGHEVELFCAAPNPLDSRTSELSESIKVTYLSNTSISNFSLYFKLYFWIRVNIEKLQDYDAIHTHLTFGLFFGTFTKLFLRRNRQSRPTLIFTCHLVGMNVPKFKLRYHRALSGLFDHFVLMGVDQYWNKFATKSRLFSFIPNGIEPLAKVEITKRTNPRIGTLSRLVAERRPSSLVNLFGEISKSVPQAQFAIGGEGPEYVGLIRQAEQLSISNLVTFLGKVENVREFYATLNIYITLNVGPITGISGLEAVSAGIPTLAIQLDQSYLGGEKDWIASFTNYSSLTNFLTKLIEDEDLLEQYISKQHKAFKNRYTCKMMTENYLKIYGKAR